MCRARKPTSPFRYFKTSPEVIRIAVLMYVRFPLSLRNVEDLLFDRGIDVSYETVRLWWVRFGLMFAADIRRQRVDRMTGFRHWRTHYLWRAVDHEGEVLESHVTRKRDKAAALRFLKKALKRHGQAEKIVTDGLKSYPSAMREPGNEELRETGQWKNNRAENSHLPFRRRERAMLRFRQMSRYRSSPRFTPVFIITSTKTATSSIVKPARPAARSRWPSCKTSWLEVRHE